MKLHSHVLAGILSLAASLPLSAAMPVIDAGMIRTHLASARRDLAEQLVHSQRALMQYEQLVSQVRQIDTYLRRFGDPSAISPETLLEAARFLEKLESGKTSAKILEAVSGEEIFDRAPDPAHRVVAREVRIEGRAVAQRHADSYAPEAAERRMIAHYEQVRSEVLQKRASLRAAQDAALKELGRATTASEVARLDILIRSLESQLEATGTELQLAATAATVQTLQNRNEERVLARANVEDRRAGLKVATEKELAVFRLPSQPLPFKTRTSSP